MVKCENCGHVIEGMDTPMICPICGHIMKPVVERKKTTKKSKEETVEMEDSMETFHDELSLLQD